MGDFVKSYRKHWKSEKRRWDEPRWCIGIGIGLGIGKALICIKASMLRVKENTTSFFYNQV